MVKPTPSHSKATPQAPDARNTGHPLLKNESQAMDLLKRFKQEQEQDEVLIERQLEWKDCLNRLASTGDGQHFLKLMIKHSGVFVPRNVSNTVKMVEDAGKSAFYLKHVRPYLDSSLLAVIEMS